MRRRPGIHRSRIPCRATAAPTVPTPVLAPLLALLLATGCGGAAGEDPHAVRRVTHAFDQALSGIATGTFEVGPAAFPDVPIPPRYTHVMRFLVTPFLPPRIDRLDAAGPMPSRGPIVLFNTAFEARVIGPADHPFAVVMDVADGAVRSGLSGEIDAVPAGTAIAFVDVEGPGIVATMLRWGREVRRDRSRAPVDRYADTGVATLGYWTDNGATYYYATAPGLDAQDTLLAVRDEAATLGIPYGYFQLDSWWYFKERTARINPGGLVRWTPRPEHFPDGLATFHDRLGLPLVAHNRWFALENDYRAIGEWVAGEEMAFPIGRAVFDAVLEGAAGWGLETYEQDWLNSQWVGVPWLRQGIGRPERWMADLDAAVADAGLTMQLCMADAGHLVASVDMPTVTSIRTSIDYQAGLSKESFWPQFHTINVLAWGLGLVPFKDNFHSAEAHGEAEALISALSAGMVGGGDGLGASRPDVLLRTCRADGVLLKPDRPAFPLDAMFLPHARPYTVATEVDVPGAGRYALVAGFHLARAHPDRTAADEVFALVSYDGVDPGAMFPWPDAVSDWSLDPAAELGLDDAPRVALDWRTGTVTPLDGDPIDLPSAPGCYDWTYVVLAPVLDNGLALLGETAKYVPVADRRIRKVATRGDAVIVDLLGAPGETVVLRAWDARAGAYVADASVTLDGAGTGTATLSR